MKKYSIALLMLAVTFLLTGCAAVVTEPTMPPLEDITKPPVQETPIFTETPTAEPTEVPTAEPTEEPTAEPTSEPTPEPAVVDPFYAPEGKSPTTGLDFTGLYQPVLVSIGYTKEARPGWGLSQADILTEFLMEGQSVTRLNAVFNDVKPTKVGAVRSARFPFVREWTAWGNAVIAYYGSPKGNSFNADELMKKYGFATEQMLSGMYGRNDKYYTRQSVRGAPHNVTADLQLITDNYYGATELDHEKRFTFESTAADAITEAAGSIHVQYKGTAKDVYSDFKYDADKDTYVWYANDKNPQTDFEGNTLQFRNVIVRHVKHTTPDSGYVDIEPLGEGDAEFFLGGKYVHGIWKRDAIESRVMYYTDSGKEMVFLPGKTFICMARTDGICTHE